MTEEHKLIPVESLIKTYDECPDCPLVKTISQACHVRQNENRILYLLTCKRHLGLSLLPPRIVKRRSFVAVLAARGRFDNISDPKVRINGYGVKLLELGKCPAEG